MSAKKRFRVAMIAPPWLAIPPKGYGGIENLLAVLVPALMNLGVEVELFTVKESRLRATKNHWLYETGQYDHIHEPLYSSLPVALAHSLFALNRIEADGKFNLIHCHNGFIGPFAAVLARDSMPPSLHTLHGPPFSSSRRPGSTPPDNLPMWTELAKSPKLYMVGISKALTKAAPASLKRRMLPAVHNGVDPAKFPFRAKKRDYFATLARAHPDKGQALAVQACQELGVRLKLAGLVCDMTSPKKVLLELANPLSSYRNMVDFRYFSDEIFPHLEPGHIDYIGDLSGSRKLNFLASARALLFPIQWDEPFGMAVIEALACGTPVVAMNRGAMPEIIEHGVTGFLAKTKREFIHYTKRVGELDPEACRRSVEERFSAERAARNYLDRYKTVLKAAD